MPTQIETEVELPAAEAQKIFGSFDRHLKEIEKKMNVTILQRDGSVRSIPSSCLV